MGPFANVRRIELAKSEKDFIQFIIIEFAFVRLRSFAAFPWRGLLCVSHGMDPFSFGRMEHELNRKYAAAPTFLHSFVCST